MVLFHYCLEKGHDRSVIRHFSIEPAVSYIGNFDMRVYEKVEEMSPRFFDYLAEATLQGSKEIFFNLARGGGTVTHKLACRIANAIENEFGDDVGISLGIVRVKTGTYSALRELIDADDESVLNQCDSVFKRHGIKITP